MTNLSLFLGFNDDDARFNIEDSVAQQQQQPHTHTHAFFVCGGAVYVKKTASIVFVPYTRVVEGGDKKSKSRDETELKVKDRKIFKIKVQTQISYVLILVLFCVCEYQKKKHFFRCKVDREIRRSEKT